MPPYLLKEDRELYVNKTSQGKERVERTGSRNSGGDKQGKRSETPEGEKR